MPDDSFQLPTDNEPTVEPLPAQTPADAAKLLQALKDAKPSWMEDGLGIRGIPVVVTNTKAQLEWDSSVTFRRPVIDQPDP
jgi:hypothetical protein